METILIFELVISAAIVAWCTHSVQVVRRYLGNDAGLGAFSKALAAGTVRAPMRPVGGLVVAVVLTAGPVMLGLYFLAASMVINYLAGLKIRRIVQNSKEGS